MRRSRLFAILGPAVALVVSACSAGSSRGATAPSPASDAAASARPAVTLSTVGAANPAALPRTSTAAASVTLTAVGDMMLGITPVLPPGPASYFEAVEPALKHGAQIVFGNLEGTLTTARPANAGPGRARTASPCGTRRLMRATSRRPGSRS
jgi:hypothetical protein